MDSEIIDTTKMSTRGQVIIPKDIREYIGVERDTIFTVMPLDKDTIIMKKMDKKKLLDEFRNIRNSVGKLTSKEIENEIKGYRKAKGSN
jgi:bifunctional DNA-binding transcriptional regulator/antitoxin component of YhaV-PrlF toxin-antitoxin module